MDSLFIMMDETLREKSLLAYLFAYTGGVLVSFTACSYSLLPATMVIIGAGSAQTGQSGFLLSLVYVLGLSASYTALGALAVFAGILFGSVQASPLVNLIVTALFITMGMSLLGVFNLPLFVPRFVNEARVNIKATGYLKVFLLGAVSALIMSPCVSPIVLALLGYTALSGNVFYGMSLFLFFSLGMGTLMIIAGSLAGFLFSLSKSGAWLMWINRICGIILIAVGVYFLAQVFFLWGR